jgi:hypothetical protein
MPFTRLKRKNKRGQRLYRSPSGRTFTEKQVKLYYAKGGTFDANHVHDAAPSQRDPTGTLKLRRSLVKELDGRWRSLRRLIAAQVGVGDLFAMNPTSIGPLSMLPGDQKMRSAQGWIDAALTQYVLGYDEAQWFALGVQRAYAAGVQRAVSAVGRPIGVDESRQTLHGMSSVVELEGVAEAVSQRVMRVMTASLVTRASSRVAAQAMSHEVETIGAVRGRLAVSMGVVRAYSEGTLDALQDLGVRRVSIAPEHEPHRIVTDAPRQTPQPRNRSGQFRAFARAPGRGRLGEIERTEQRLGSLGMVNVLTAGDDKVCPRCEDIAANGPYLIDEARGLIPAHPSCRCAFDPVDGDQEFDTEDGVQDSFDPNLKKEDQ